MSVNTPRTAARTGREQSESGFIMNDFLTWQSPGIGAKSPHMIPRYTRPQMAAIWTPANRFRIWFEIEAHACDAMAKAGVIPKDAAKAIWTGGKKAMEALKANPDAEIAKIDAIERVTKHDVLAFTT